MFDTQINSLEAQIAEITARLARFRSVESDFKSVAKAIATLQENANQLSVESGDYLRGELAKLVGIAPDSDRPTSNSDIPKKDDRLFSESSEKAIAIEPEITPVLSSEKAELVSEEELERDIQFLSALDEEDIPKGDRPKGENETAIIEFLDEETRYLAMIDDEPTPVAVADNQLDLIDATEAVKRYDSAAEIAEALADIEEIDAHLMAIASVLDCCPENELAGRVWFLTQNIPIDYDDRLFAYLPKNISVKWKNQRVLMQEEEARASILPPPVQPHYFEVGDLAEVPAGKMGHISHIHFDPKLGRVAGVVVPGGTIQCPVNDLKYFGKYQPPTPEFNVGDWVELYNGEIAQVTQTKDIGSKIYIEVNGKDAYRTTDLKPAQAPMEVKGEVVAPVASATAKKNRKPKAKPGTAAEILKCKTWGEIRAIANNDPKLIKEAATSAHTKTEKELIEKLPELIRDYMYESRDFSDLDWLPNYIKQRVRCLMSEPGTAA